MPANIVKFNGCRRFQLTCHDFNWHQQRERETKRENNRLLGSLYKREREREKLPASIVKFNVHLLGARERGKF